MISEKCRDWCETLPKDRVILTPEEEQTKQIDWTRRLKNFTDSDVREAYRKARPATAYDLLTAMSELTTDPDKGAQIWGFESREAAEREIEALIKNLRR